MNRVFTYIFAFLSLSLVGCSISPKDLQTAEQLMETAPDSSLHILQSISHNNYMSESERALYGLLMFQAQDKNFIPLTPDTLIDFSIAYYERKGQKSRLATSYLYKARMYKYASHYEDATMLLMKAVDNADKTKDHVLLGRIYTDLGDISFIQHDYINARTEYKQEYEFYKKTSSKRHILEALLAVGRTYFAVHKYDSASIYYKQALLHSTDSLSKGSCMQEIGQNYYALKQYDSALHYLQPIIHYPYIKNNRAIRYYVLADVYFDLKQLDSAYFYANATFKFCPDINTRHGCYRILGNTAFLKKNTEEMSHYLSLYTACSDSIKKIESQTRVSVMKKLHQNNKEIKSGLKNSIILTLLLFMVLLSSIIIMYFFNKKHTRNKEKQDIQIKQVQSILVQKQHTLVDDLKQKVEHEKLKQADIRKKATQSERDALTMKLYESTLHLNDWKEFSRLMNYTFNNVVATLENSGTDIKKTDIIWCCLHLLDVPHPERIIVLHVSSGSLYKIKQRLALKLHLNGAKMLDKYLKQFKDILIS
jgi:tetratricopeptide (TPR) repeat protein